MIKHHPHIPEIITPFTLIRNATLVSMDTTIGNATATDILIDGEKIAVVGKPLNAVGLPWWTPAISSSLQATSMRIPGGGNIQLLVTCPPV